MIATRPSGNNNLSDRSHRTVETSNIIAAGHSAGNSNPQDSDGPATVDSSQVTGC